MDRESFGGEHRIIRSTYSLCPVCLRRIPAMMENDLERSGIYMRKTCPDHGEFRVRVWGDSADLEEWILREEPLNEKLVDACGGDCRSCRDRGASHGQDTCCVILETTKRCNLRCTYCFARGGEDDCEPPYEELCKAIDDIVIKGSGPLLQLSGGEPTLRDDLPDLVRYALDAGCQYTQINTNGIRLAEDEDYVRRLSDAGLDIAFLQFDGTDDEIYRKLRGRDLLDIKLRAISNCDKYKIGVTLVPTIVSGVNDGEIGNIIRKAAELFPAVRAVHFQPVTYLGRYPVSGSMKDIPLERYNLDDLMRNLFEQTGIPRSSLLPSRCDHAMCEFHSTFMLNRRRQLIPMTERSKDSRRERTGAARNRRYVAEHWRRDKSASAAGPAYEFDNFDPEIPLVDMQREVMDFDEFVRRMRTQTLKISAMAFQDAMNIDLERLYRCSLHVYEDGRLPPLCAKYMTAVK